MRKTLFLSLRMHFAKTFIAGLIFLTFSINGNTQEENELMEINEVWGKFCEAFETLDPEIMADIHWPDLVRISGGSKISDYDTYISGYKERFTKNSLAGKSNNISLRFFERLCNDSIASERGVYELIYNKGRETEQKHYGQFHVIFKKRNETWKIWMDYDSDENGSIGEEDLQKARAMDDLVPFLHEAP
ncbi:MAG: nuclear transport factor 2 family protein [Flavobacteriales bacterium]|nr:nuclear transport factor 2 family protein [Flavobacteriales bacterium]